MATTRITSTPQTTTARTTSTLASDARAWAERIDFRGPQAEPLLVSREAAPTTGPAALQRAHALYRTWEENDLGSVRMLKTAIDGKTVYALHTSTDGDDSFVELFDASGKLLASGVGGLQDDGNGGFSPTITWDATPGAVRERVAPGDVSDSVKAFTSAIAGARASGTASGTTVSTAELKGALGALVGNELTTASVDGFESAALRKVLADPSVKLTSTARQYAEKVGALYADSLPAKLGKPKVKPASDALSLGGAWAQGASVATASVSSGGPVDASTMSALTQAAFKQLPTQVVPATRSEAIEALKASGASAAEAKKAVDALSASGASLYTGRLFNQGNDWIPKATGTALFAVSASGTQVSALMAPEKTTPSTVDVKAVIAQLTGVERDVNVLARRQTPQGEAFDLAWSAPWLGLVTATLTVPRDGEPTLSGAKIPSFVEPNLRAGLAEDVSESIGGTPVEVAGWVGRDNSQGPGFVVAWRPAGSTEPLRLSTVRIAMGGAATVTDKKLTTSASDATLARDLAINLARAHAQGMVADQSDAAKLEVALRTAWLDGSALSQSTAEESPVGFNPSKERVQLGLSSVWGDNAVFVTFAKDGTLRVEDAN